MENNQTLQSSIVSSVQDKDAIFNARLAEEKMRMLTERLNAANETLGLNNEHAGKITAKNGFTDDILPFIASKKGAKLLRGTKYNHLWVMHTNDYWDKQMNEVEGLALVKVTEEMAQESDDSPPANNSGIVLR